MSDQISTVQHPVLDRAPRSINGALSLYTMKDGSRRIGGRDEFVGEHNGSIGFPWKDTYRTTMDDVIRQLENSAKHWVEFAVKYLLPEHCKKRFHQRTQTKCTTFVSGGEAYTAFHGTHHTGAFLGFGGDLVTVTMADGRVIETNNLWHNGTVPHYMREVLKDNATLVWGRAKTTGSAS